MIAVQKDVQHEEEALVTSYYWQIDGLRKENLSDIRETKDSICIKCRELRNLQFQGINFWMRERERAPRIPEEQEEGSSQGQQAC